MADRLCDQDRRNVTNYNIIKEAGEIIEIPGLEDSDEGKKKVSGADKLRASLALYLRNWKKGYLGGRRERIIDILRTKILEDLFVDHEKFCRKCEPVLKDYGEKELKKEKELRNEWRAYIDNAMEVHLLSVYKRKFDKLNENEASLKILLDPNAEEDEVIRILNLFIEGNRERLFNYKPRLQYGAEYIVELRNLFLAKRKEILIDLDVDMKAHGWNWKKREERVERFLYRLEHEAAKKYKQQIGVLELLTKEETKTFQSEAETILDTYLDIKKNEPHEFHRMQLIIHLKEDLRVGLLEKVKDYRKKNGTGFLGSAQDAVQWMDSVFEPVFKSAYEDSQKKLENVFQEGADLKDTIDAVYYGFLRRQKWMEMYEKGTSVEIPIGYKDNPVYVDAWEVISGLYLVIAKSVEKYSKSYLKPETTETMKRYGFDPAIKSEWIERMILICFWDVERELDAFAGELYKDGNTSERISWEDMLASRDEDDDEQAVVAVSEKERTKAMTDHSQVDEAEYLMRAYSVMTKTKELIRKVLKTDKVPHRKMPLVFYIWIYPFYERQNVDDIIDTYVANAKSQVTAQKNRAKGYARTNYGNILWNQYRDQELIWMRLDMDSMLNKMLDICGFSGKFVPEDYRVLDRDLDIWDFRKNEQCMIRVERTEHEGSEETDKNENRFVYELRNQKMQKMPDNPKAKYHKLFGEVVSGPDAISKNISSDKYSTKIDKKTKEEKPVYDWVELTKDINTTIEKDKGGVFYGRYK